LTAVCVISIVPHRYTVVLVFVLELYDLLTGYIEYTNLARRKMTASSSTNSRRSNSSSINKHQQLTVVLT
jgi:hypothetical protein